MKIIRPSRFRPFSLSEKHEKTDGRNRPLDVRCLVLPPLFPKIISASKTTLLLLKSNPARRVPLRCGTQFALCLGLIVLRMTVAFAGEKSKIRCTPLISRGRNRARSGNGTPHVPFPSSKAVKAPPGLCQESAFSPPWEEPRGSSFPLLLKIK